MGTSFIASLFLQKLQKAEPKLLGTWLGSKRESEAGGVKAAARPAVTPAQEAGLQALTRDCSRAKSPGKPSRRGLGFPLSVGGRQWFQGKGLVG